MASVEIRPVRTRRDLKRFVKVPFRLHRDHPQWVPPLIFERMEFLDREKNPWFEHGEAEYFIAERDGEPVGRITAQIDERWDETQGGSDAMFGFFETVDDPDVAGARCSTRPPSGPRARGRTRILGPMDFTTNDEVGILIEGYELRPYILENWHPPYYKTLLEAHGFGKAMDLLMWELELGSLKEGEEFDPSIHAAAEKALRDEGVTIRNIDKGNLAREMRLFTAVYNDAWVGQLGLRPADRRRGRVPRQEPQAGARRGLGLHRRKGRRGDRRRAHPARHQPGDGEAGRAAAALRLAALPARQAQDRPPARLRARRQARVPPHAASPPASTSSTSRPPASRARSKAARWAGSSRPTSR